jgi:hypothetical protein
MKNLQAITNDYLKVNERECAYGFEPGKKPKWLQAGLEPRAIPDDLADSK